MSQKQVDLRSIAEAHTQESPMIDTGSCNVCSANQSDSDSESVLESRELRLLREQTAEGLAEIIARFWSKVDTSGECWLWTASTMDRYGHGQFTIRDTIRYQHHLYAHRVAWALDGFEIAPNMKLCHTCDVALCVRSSHLFIGTQQDNLNDARQKGRLIDGAHLIKLSDTDMLDIRTNYRPRFNGKALAAKYGISVTHLLRVVNGTARVQRAPVDPFVVNNVEVVPQAFHVRHRPSPVISTISPMFGR